MHVRCTPREDEEEGDAEHRQRGRKDRFARQRATCSAASRVLANFGQLLSEQSRSGFAVALRVNVSSGARRRAFSVHNALLASHTHNMRARARAHVLACRRAFSFKKRVHLKRAIMGRKIKQIRSFFIASMNISLSVILEQSNTTDINRYLFLYITLVFVCNDDV